MSQTPLTANNIWVMTVPLLEGRKITAYKGFVSARNTRAVNIIRDLFTSFRDVFGGRSESYESIMADMEREILTEITEAALRMGANAIVGFELDFDNIGSKGKSLLMAYGKGTAVIIE